MSSKSMFKMPDLQDDLNPIQEDSGDESDTADGQQILSLLVKLKGAKAALDTSKKRKLAQQKVSEAMAKWKSESRDLVARHKRNNTSHVNKITEKFKNLEVRVMEVNKKIEAYKMKINILNESKLMLEQMSLKIDTLEKELYMKQKDLDEATKTEIAQARLQIENKLKETDKYIKKIQTSTMKEDKFTVLLKAIIDDLIN